MKTFVRREMGGRGRDEGGCEERIMVESRRERDGKGLKFEENNDGCIFRWVLIGKQQEGMKWCERLRRDANIRAHVL